METVLLTGASGGLGLHLASQLLENGYFVLLHYFKQKEVLNDFIKKYPNQTLLVPCDFREEKNIIAMKEFIESEGITIHHLINNAAIDHVSNLKEKTEESFLEVFRINTLAPFHLMKYFGPSINTYGGSIINISSDNAIDRYDEVTLEYDLSKIGLNHLTKIFANIYPNAKVNAICFGWLDTKMNKIPEDIKKEIQFVPFDIATKKVMEYLKTKETGKIEIVR